MARSLNGQWVQVFLTVMAILEVIVLVIMTALVILVVLFANWLADNDSDNDQYVGNWARSRLTRLGRHTCMKS